LLLNLQIKNFILIDQLDINFHDGFTVITGQSGSGKSLILQAISAVCGARINNINGNSVLKSLAAKTTLTAEFSIENSLDNKLQSSIDQNMHVGLLLQEHNLIDEDNPYTIIIKRIITPDNKSKIYINDNQVSLNLVKQITDELINFNTQHTHIHLMDQQAQQKLLDQYVMSQQVESREIFAQISETYQSLIKLQQKILDFNQNAQQNEIQREYLQEKITACSNLAFTAEEYNEIELEHKQLTNRESVQHELNILYQLLENNDELNEYLKQIYNASNKLQDLSTNGKLLTNYTEAISSNFRDLKSLVIQDLYKLDSQEERLNELEKIIANVYEVTKRYKISQAQIKEMLPIWQKQLEQLQSFGIDELLLQEKSLKEKYYKYAEKLSTARKITANELSKKITALMPEVSLTGSFHIAFKNQEPTKTGTDHIQFMVNFSKEPSKLQAIGTSISGGELARIALLIYSTLKQDHETVIFDEIDVGISGSTASNVGKLLFNMSHANNQEKKQVICITHQAQTSGFADYHLLVTKKDNINACYLDNDNRVNELARIISGINVTETSLKHAKELMESSTEIKGKLR
jgi:DNA repair protein RecN (Recombination protein N)